MKNLLLEEIEYKIDQTPLGTWRRFMYPDGRLFQEFVSHQRLFGLPLLHYTYGKCPETGHRIVAKGIIAIGRLAVGGLAIGQLALGKYVLAQIGFGEHVWDTRGIAPAARNFFRPLMP
jgi:hypothetical protein